MPKFETTPASGQQNPCAPAQDTTPTFAESFAIADCVARQFIGTYPTSEQSAKLRYFLQLHCVPAARWLWRHGGVDGRAALATRLAIWRGLDRERVQAISARVRLRERVRAEGGAQ